ncbi:hypothetical protein CU098_008906 [Rhizopus stolonifer]|uniref:Polysaccharide lyase 14 domain-containing protein n=1 Tax=Rhizopus stolonifer TaxID=4846 RepID=A0A367JBB6_RHIST|nr:hypothetical protein CU098_008906 [Rhizopus stolonifer]
MIKTHLILFTIAIIACLFSTIEAAKSNKKTWAFHNWNKYKKATVGKPTVWDAAWGIPEHSGWLWFWQGAEKNKNVLVTDPSKKTKDLVLRVKYPKNSRNPEASPVGGLGFKAEPLTITNKVKTVTLQYSVYFDKGFDWNRGGKLPGLFGGHGECTGGDDSSKCFTTRIMWRHKGEGEIYAYLPSSAQRLSLCDNKANICNPDYGYSLGRGSFKFATGKWTTVRQTLTMNTPGKKNGSLSLYINGKRVINEKNLVFRINSTGRVVGIMFHTFFGGSDNSWKTSRNQYSYFKNFSLKLS